MRKFSFVLILMAALGFGAYAFGQAAPAAAPVAAAAVQAAPAAVQAAPVDANVAFLQLLLQSLGGMKGASIVAIVGVIVQLLLQFLDLPFIEGVLGKAFSDWSGKIKLLVISGLTLVSGVVGLMGAGHLSLGAALVHSSTLTAVMVFMNQIYQQVQKPSDPAPLTVAKQ